MVVEAGGPVRWPCLMYHGTPDDASGATVGYFDVGATQLRDQAELLAREGLLGRPVESLIAQPSPRSVAITFDDALESNIEVALPILAAVGATATVFVVTSWVGTARYCSWSQLRTLADAGWSVQSHTVSHPFLSTLTRDGARHELRASRLEIEDHLGRPVSTISLPNGDAPAESLEAVLDETGYRWAVSSRWSWNVDGGARARVFNRYTVRRATTLDQFGRLVRATVSPYSAEGLRLQLLARVRGAVGVERYRSIRRMLVRGH